MSRIAPKSFDPSTGIPKPSKAPKKPRKGMRRVSPKKARVWPGDGLEASEKGPFVSQTLRQFARGRECQMKSEWCNGNPETVVLCHSRRRAGAGMGQKPHDFWAYHGCSGCHENEHRLEDRELYDAIRRTQYVVFDHFKTLTP